MSDQTLIGDISSTDLEAAAQLCDREAAGSAPGDYHTLWTNRAARIRNLMWRITKAQHAALSASGAGGGDQQKKNEKETKR
jgi:hypothetical protein